MTTKHFKVSSALKNIIGKDLITDDFVAIFELVKNSFDANANRVDVVFDQILSENGRIVIKDNGKGMDLVDIEEKWLFVAYSAKKEGIEDYRDEIKSKRIHAGAKGIGRFSCDRLGRQLTIYSRRKKSEKISKLVVEWKDFEKNMQEKFEQIPVFYELVDQCEYDIDAGTVLEISDIRLSWDANKLSTLRRSLEKLINPSQSNTKTPFSIYLKAEDFKNHDKAAKEEGNEHLIINGKVKNFLFEKLDVKTTRIEVSIDSDGESITTELFDRGNFVYRMVEENPFVYEDWFLSDIRVHLFSLNQTSKSMFTKYMGIRPVQFGSVFVYKNGFRIHPIGEIGRGDVFGLDGRKQQGTSRYLGTRDLIGRIEINGENEQFREASSRDGGLERNFAFKSLNDFFISHVLKRLERFAVDVVRFGSVDSIDILSSRAEFPKETALSFIESLTKSESIHDIEFNSDIFDVVSNASEKSLTSLLKNLGRIAEESNNPDLDSEVLKIEKRLNEFSKASQDAEEQARRETQKRKEAEKLAREQAEKAKAAELAAEGERQKAVLVTKQSIFLRSIVSSEIENVVALHHHIGIAAGTIENYVVGVSKRIRSGKPVTTDSFLKVLDEISFVARQISATTKFATKANFNLEAELIKQDLSEYIEEYVLNICAGLIKVRKDISRDVEFEWHDGFEGEFSLSFRPLEVAMIVDNLVNNSVKADATKISFSSSSNEKDLLITVRDNGSGIKESIKDQIFEMGFTTSNGAGLGLHHIKTILQGMKGEIYLSDYSGKGAEFVLKFTR